MSLDAALDAAIDAWLEPYSGDVPGASLLVRQDGRDRVALGRGFADLEAGVPATPDTAYRLASVSKQFTAACVLLLAETHRLDLRDPARRWLPGLPSSHAPITLLDLLTHRSGLPDYEDLLPPGDGQLRDADVMELLASHRQLDFAPGSAYRYSNGGYALLALVVERAAGMDFPGFLRERIFRPLGMHNSLARVEGGPTVANRAYGYSQAGGGWRRTDQGPTTAVLGDGGIYSSIADLTRWDEAWDDARLLSDASRRLATSAWTSTDQAGTHYGLGWRISGDCHWHSGESLGFRNVLLRIPSRRLSLVMLSNRDDPEPADAAMAIARLLVG
jgi:CubicO group peptidase (beta-lactamase class C family)